MFYVYPDDFHFNRLWAVPGFDRFSVFAPDGFSPSLCPDKSRRFRSRRKTAGRRATGVGGWGERVPASTAAPARGAGRLITTAGRDKERTTGTGDGACGSPPPAL